MGEPVWGVVGSAVIGDGGCAAAWTLPRPSRDSGDGAQGLPGSGTEPRAGRMHESGRREARSRPEPAVGACVSSGAWQRRAPSALGGRNKGLRGGSGVVRPWPQTHFLPGVERLMGPGLHLGTTSLSLVLSVLSAVPSAPQGWLLSRQD